MRIRLILLVLAVGLGLGACSEEPARPPVDVPKAGPLTEIGRGDKLQTEIAGIWQSRGYGWIVEISADGVTRYGYDGKVCFATPQKARGMTEMLSIPFRYYRLGPRGRWAVLQFLPDDTQIVFDRRKRLPAACTAERDWSRAEIFDYYARLLTDHYAFFKRRNIDWPARVAAAREKLPEVQSDADFFDLLAEMIDGFSDSHTKLIAEINGKRRKQQDGQGTTLPMVRAQGGENPWLTGIFEKLRKDVLDPGSQHVGKDRILWGLIDGGRIGYLQVLIMGGFTDTPISDPGFRDAELAAFDSIMDKAFTAFRDTEAVIVDLSNNRGGYDAISRKLAGRFTDKPFLAYRASATGSGIAPQERVIEPADGPRYTGPVYLLTSDVTVSGGEIATLALRQLDNVTHVGGTTRGAFSTPLAKALPNGWVVEISNEVFKAPDGTVYEKTGIEPQRAVDVFPPEMPVLGHAAAVEDIVRRLGTGQPVQRRAE